MDSQIGWVRSGDLADNESDSDDEEEDMDTCAQVQGPPQFYAEQITLQQYEVQKKDFTKAAVQNLVNSPEYQRKLNTCESCWCCWLEGQFSESCLECGGFALKRPCGICKGKCQSVWDREVEMSHSMHEAYWDGECGLPPEEKERFLYELFASEGGEEAMLDALEDLSTS